MESFLPLLTVASITTLAVLSPGPNFVVITKNALIYSRRAGLYTAMGVVAGNAVYVAAGALGFAALVAQSEQLLSLIRLMGAAYLVYLGATLFLSTRNLGNAANQQPAGIVLQNQQPRLAGRAAFRSGLLTMLTNPTGALFYLAIFTVVLPPETMVSMKVMAAVIILLIVIVWHPLLAWFFSNQLFQKFYARGNRWINATFSLLLVALAIRTISS
jgi:threonine/homoserine/homoserine lactone efflux protein